MSEIDDIKRLAGIKLIEGANYFELRQYNIGNSRPFITTGHRSSIIVEVRRLLDAGEFAKLEIIPQS